jgi:hypothetical protein
MVLKSQNSLLSNTGRALFLVSCQQNNISLQQTSMKLSTILMTLALVACISQAAQPTPATSKFSF